VRVGLGGGHVGGLVCWQCWLSCVSVCVVLPCHKNPTMFHQGHGFFMWITTASCHCPPIHPTAATHAGCSQGQGPAPRRGNSQAQDRAEGHSGELRMIMHK
jgi:hypothetical protein